jgi:DNA-binding transcriptional MerR regulator
MSIHYTMQQVSKLTRVPYSTLKRWVADGVLVRRGPRTRGGGYLFLPRDLMEAHIAAHIRARYTARAVPMLYAVMRQVQSTDHIFGKVVVLDFDGNPLVAEPEDERTLLAREHGKVAIPLLPEHL